MSTVDKTSKNAGIFKGAKIFKEIKANLRLLLRYFSVNLQSSMEYKSNFLIQSFGMVLNNASFILYWWVLFSKMGNTIGGYSFKQVLVIWAIASSGFGVSQVVFGNAMRMSDLIVDGQLDGYLLQPKNVLWNLLISRTSISAWGDFLYGVALFAFAMPFTLYNWGLFFLFVLLAGFLMTAVVVLANTLTFYLGRANAIAGLVPDFLITMTIYPEGIFGGKIRFLLYTILPAGFISYIPVRLLHQFSSRYLVYLLAFDAAFIVLTFWVFHRGLKQYESGNLMQSRI